MTSIPIGLRYYHSWDHLNAAALHAHDAKVIEDAGSTAVVPRVRHRGFVTGSIFSAIAYLEAAINELLSDCRDCVGNCEVGTPLDSRLDREAADAIGSYWEEKCSDFSVRLKDKYQKVLDCAGKDPMNRGGSLWYNLDRVLKLRNALVHYAPETQGFIPGRNDPPNHLIDKLFKDRPFGLNPIALNPDPFWPDRCLSFDCANWCLDVALDWAFTFCSQMKTVCLLIPHRDHVDEVVITRAQINEIKSVI